MATLDHSQEYLVWDNREAVTFRSRGTNASQDFPISDAKRRAPTYKELAASNGAYTGQDLVWLIPATLAPAYTSRSAPKPGDKVVSAEATWTALEVALNNLKSTWRLVTRNLVLAYDLRDTVDIERATVTYDAAGGPLRTFAAVYSALACKVQLITQELADVLGVRGFKGTYAVTVAQDVTLVQGDRVKWGSVYLDVLKQHNPQRIDELPVLDCVKLP